MAKNSNATETGAASEDAIAEAAVDDLNAATVTLEFRGQSFVVPKRRGRWPVEAVRQFGRGNRIDGLSELLGGKDWKRLKSVAPLTDDFNEFADQAVTQLNAETIL